MSDIVTYKNGNYFVLLDKKTGTKIRYNDEDKFVPDRVESIDVTISKHCTMNCGFCYAGCSKDGKHADIMSHSFIDNLEPYTELALNGNEPLHPDLVSFLKKCKKLKLIPSLTVNQHTFMKNIELLKKLSDDRLIYGLGVSLTDPNQEFIDVIKQFPNAVIHVINGVCEKWELKKLAGNDLKILILGYKTFGRGIDYYNYHNNIAEYNKDTLYNALPDIINDEWFDVVSFDNLALEQLDVKRLMSEDEWSKFYMGNDGKFSMYIDMVDGMFYKNSMSENGYELTDDIVYMFDMVRKV